MNAIRRAAWFFSLSLMMACIMGVIGSIRGEAVAGVIASHGTDGMVARNVDMTKVQTFLEQKIVLQKLSDYGVSADEAMEKVRAMSDPEVHRLASLTDRAAEGTDSGLGILIGLAVLVLLIVLILKLTNKKIIVR
jgi:hypothetical protein